MLHDYFMSHKHESKIGQKLCVQNSIASICDMLWYSSHLVSQDEHATSISTETDGCFNLLLIISYCCKSFTSLLCRPKGIWPC